MCLLEVTGTAMTGKHSKQELTCKIKAENVLSAKLFLL